MYFSEEQNLEVEQTAVLSVDVGVKCLELSILQADSSYMYLTLTL